MNEQKPNGDGFMAFPLANPPFSSGLSSLTPRQYIAGAALSGLLARGVSLAHAPKLAVEYADALLREIEK